MTILPYLRALHRACALFAGFLAACALPGAETPQARARLVDANRSACLIVYPAESPLHALTAERLAAYIERQTDVRVPVVVESAFAAQKKPDTVIVVDGTKNLRLARRFDDSIALSSDRSEAYRLKVTRRDGPTLVLLAGNSPAGAKYAAYRLMDELTITGRNASVGALDIAAEPFLNTRIISFGNVWGMPNDIQRNYNLEAWPLERLDPYIDMFDRFGFNAVEALDRYGDDFLRACFGVTREEWRNKIHRISDRLHENGGKMFLRAWGASVMAVRKGYQPTGENDTVLKTITDFCPNNPVHRQRWETEIRDYYLKNHVGRIDHFLGHWADAGGCYDPKSTCTIADPMKLHNELHHTFQAAAPGIESSFSLWWLHLTKQRHGKRLPPWRGYTDHRSVSGAGVLDKGVVIAQMVRQDDLYKERVSLDIAADGYRPAVWAWRMADQESVGDAGLHVRVERLNRYFKRLPVSARELAYHNVEVNQHGMASVINHYVAGKLMWDPTTDADRAVNDFAVKMFGEKHGPTVARAYRQMEFLRPDYKQAAKKYDAKTNIRSSGELLEELARVEVDPDFRPRLPLILTPRQILTDLMQALGSIREYNLCLTQELPAIDRAKKANDTAEQTRLLAALEQKRAAWSKTIASAYEAKRLEYAIQSRQTATASSKKKAKK